jgi:hypothetical protein
VAQSLVGRGPGPSEGMFEAAVFDRSSDAFAAFLDRDVGQADDVHDRRAEAAMGIDFHCGSIDAPDGRGHDLRQPAVKLPLGH